jgi:hypothetical protein
MALVAEFTVVRAVLVLGVLGLIMVVADVLVITAGLEMALFVLFGPGI